MPGDTLPDTTDEYNRIVKSFTVSGFDETTRREIELEVAFDEPMPDLLRRVFLENGGKKRPTLRQINNRLESADHYDGDLVSMPTLYNWIRKYRDDLPDGV